MIFIPKDEQTIDFKKVKVGQFFVYNKQLCLKLSDEPPTIENDDSNNTLIFEDGFVWLDEDEQVRPIDCKIVEI